MTNAQKGRQYYFNHIHVQNRNQMEKHKETDPMKKGFVPMSEV